MGPALCLISAAGFGAMAIFGKLAYDEGVAVLTLLALRFWFGTALLAPAAALRARRIPRRALVAAIGLGTVGYAAQSGLFFAALERMDASLLALLLYTYPAMVTVAAIAIGRERADTRRLVALAVASAGLVLVLGGAAEGRLDPLAVVLALAAAATYTAYILISDRTVSDIDPVVLSAIVAAGAATTFTAISLATGRLDLHLTPAGWLWVGCIGAVCTALAVVCFFAGMARVGPTTAAILSTFEPPVTVLLAFLAFGETLAPIQIAGAALVLGAVIALQLRRDPDAPSGRSLLRHVAPPDHLVVDPALAAGGARPQPRAGRGAPDPAR